jgi:hypothetical protein
MSAARVLRILPAGLLGAGTALLVACGSSGKGLIPVAAAGPLQNDFQAVLAAAQEGNGSCTATEAAIRQTEHDLQALPSSVDAGLRGRLAEGVANLSVRARTLCAEPIAQTTTTTTTTSPPATTTTPGAASESQTSTSPATAPTETPENEEGATRAPGAENNGNGVGNGNGRARHEEREREAEAGGQGRGGEPAGEAETEAGGPTGGTGSTR